jgi:HK97 family phage prohead protease
MTDFQARAAAYAECVREIRNAPAALTVLGADGPVAGVGFTGYASTTEDPYPVTDWLGEYQETMCRGAFTKALNDAADVRLLINHEGLPLARTKSGTMQLREDDHGLNVDVPTFGNSPYVQDVQEAMRRGDLDEMSFSFKATRQEWNDDYTERFVREVKLYDVSLVTYPANPGTSAKLRSAVPVTAEGLDLPVVDGMTEDELDEVRRVMANLRKALFIV